MAKVVRDRYLGYDGNRGCDLVTGTDVLLDAIMEDEEPCGEQDLVALMEMLEHGRDGHPRWVVAEARNNAQAAAITRRAAAGARRRGFVAISVDLYLRLRGVIEEDLRDRAMLLIGGFAQDRGSGRGALLVAAAVSPRPHVLLTFQAATASASPPVVREARAAYGSTRISEHPRRELEGPGQNIPLAADVVRHLERAERAQSFSRAGRHAAAERLLRDVGAALGRRGAHAPAAHTSLELGRLLIERGRVSAAESTFSQAARLAEAGQVQDLAALAHVWLARARTDQGRLADAESVLRAVLLTTTATGVCAWAYASLARCLLWQSRLEESAALPLDTPAGDVLAPAVVASIGDTVVRVLIETGRIFEAGQRARSGLDLAAASDDPLAHAIAHSAYLRVACAAGDLVLARSALKDALALSRLAHAPFRAARARLVWLTAVHRAGLSADAREAGASLQRFVRVAPPLLRLAIETAIRRAGSNGATDASSAINGRVDGPASTSRLDPAATSRAATLVRLSHDEEDDRAAARRVLERVAGDLGSSRIELVSADAGPTTVLLAIGLGLPTTLGSRILEAGISIRQDEGPECREAGMPVRLGDRLVAALVCRWPLDRSAPSHATDLLDVAAAVLAPRIDSLLTRAREAARASSSIPELVGVSEVMTDLRKAIARAAVAPFAVLVEGESGVGKELVARAIHQLGPRRERKFCDVNCAALPEELLESELFGHARGAFTGAVMDRAGLFEEASGGTLFLDEVADLSARAQAKLLRVVQQQEVRRVGEAFSRPVDVRLVAAANREMRVEAAAGRFRQDLLYRLDVIRLRIPPLRERPEDIPVIAAHFWQQAAERVASTAVLTPAVLADLSRYAWPGNVRELQNVLAALAVAAPARGRVRPSLLPPVIGSAAAVSSGRLDEARDQFERRFVEAALARFSGNRRRTAASLGVSRQGLLKMIARLGLEVPS